MARIRILLFTTILSTALAQQDCQFGTDVGETRRSRVRGLFINFQNPAGINGIVYGWKYCFYNNDGDPDVQFTASLLILRRNTVDNSLSIVPNSLVTVHHSLAEVASPFDCRTRNLSQEELFDIQVGDMVGACIWRNRENNIESLLLVSGDTGNNSIELLRQRVDSECDLSIETIDTTVSRTGQYLHVAAVTCNNIMSDRSSAGVNAAITVVIILVAMCALILVCVALFIYWKKRNEKSREAMMFTSDKSSPTKENVTVQVARPHCNELLGDEGLIMTSNSAYGIELSTDHTYTEIPEDAVFTTTSNLAYGRVKEVEQCVDDT